MTFDKAKRLLPSFVAHFANDAKDLDNLIRMVEEHHFRLGSVILNKLSETHSGSFHTREVKAIDLQREQLQRFLEMVR